MKDNPTCGKCRVVMTPDNSANHPELFLCDKCASDLFPGKTVEEKEAVADHAQAVLQKLRDLMLRWSERRANIRINELTTHDYRAGLFDAVGDCQTDLEELLSTQGVGQHAEGVSLTDTEIVDWIDQQLDLEIRTHESSGHDYIHSLSRKGFTLGEHPDFRCAAADAMNRPHPTPPSPQVEQVSAVQEKEATDLGLPRGV